MMTSGEYRQLVRQLDLKEARTLFTSPGEDIKVAVSRRSAHIYVLNRAFELVKAESIESLPGLHSASTISAFAFRLLSQEHSQEHCKEAQDGDLIFSDGGQLTLARPLHLSLSSLPLKNGDESFFYAASGEYEKSNVICSLASVLNQKHNELLLAFTKAQAAMFMKSASLQEHRAHARDYIRQYSGAAILM